MADRQIIPMKQHDLLPALSLRLVDDNNPNGVDLTLATEARLLVADSLSGTLKINQVMTIAAQTVPANLGVVGYGWTGADTDTVGDFDVEVQVTWPGPKPQTWPDPASAPFYVILRITKDLGP